MQNSAWIALLRLIPPAQQDNVVLTTSNNTDIAVQAVLRAETDYLVIRGRQTGTTEGGGFFFLPYDQIVYLGFQRPWKEAEIRAMFGEIVAPAKTEADQSAPLAESAAANDEPAAATSPAELAPPPTPEVKKPGGDSSPAARPDKRSGPSAQPSSTNKAALLEKLRSRRSEGGSPPPS